MNRAQFMKQLEKLLSDISEEERKEALDYYESYFDDAGPEREAEVIRELGSPGKVAAIIKADLGENRENEEEYTERGYRDSRTEDKVHLPERKEGYHADNRRGKASVILALILLVFLTPLIKGTLGGVLGFIVALILLPFLVVFGIGAVVVALFVAAVAVTVIGIGTCFSSISLGLLGTGVGLILLAIAVVALVFLVWMASRILPEILRKFTDFCNRMLNRRRKGSD